MNSNKILFITNNFPPITCGVGDYTYKLSQELVKQGWKVSILCASKPEITKNNNNFKKEGIDVFSLVESWDNKGLKQLFNVFENKNYDWVS